jgi:mRNA interferase MazF
MAIQFFPRAGQILVCDFSGFQEPEMCKVRPIIVVSPRLPHRSEIVTVVPISTTAPKHDLPFVVKLSKNYHPEEADDFPCWAKCDMVMNIGRFRLNGFKIGRRRWETPQATGDDLEAVRQGVIHGLGMGALLPKGE